MKLKKENIIPTATPGTVRIPKLKKGVDGKLLFSKTSSHPLSIEIIYSDKSLGTYETNSFNEIILLFFKKLAKFNNSYINDVDEKLEKLEKIYLVDKYFVNEQLSKVENSQNKEIEKQNIIQNFTSYPLEYSDSEVNDIIGLIEKQNIIRRTLDEYSLLMKDLASSIGINVNTLRSQASKNEVTTQTKRAIELYIENIQLKKELEKYKNNK
ncbi:MAG: hypothetical protein U9P72_01835 [Campylobacterota bacterium]|nr:hypothetical protein [Campylobacterota bacterium]